MITQPIFDYPAILRYHRSFLGMTQLQVSEAIGVKRTTYQAYEEGRSTPPLELLFALMHLYGVPNIHDFLLMTVKYSKKRNPMIESYYKLPPDKRKLVDFILNQK